MAYQHLVGNQIHRFEDLKSLMACATPLRSGDMLAGIAAHSAGQHVAARWALAELPLRQFLNEALVPYEADEVTRLIIDSHDAVAFVTGCWARRQTRPRCAHWRRA